MILALSVSALVAIALLSDIVAPRVSQIWARHRARRRMVPELALDPGRERRAEQTARELLRSCVGEEEWAMYRELGFIRVWGSHTSARSGGVEYAYLIYPHRPIVAYAPQTGRLLGEYCVEFPDDTRPYGSSRLPDSDDVLAKWMALTGDERRLLATANLHLPGRQVDAAQVTRDLWRLSRWEQARMRDVASTLGVSTQPPQA
ncbi:MAG TPA: hypothetical protein VHV75_01915 [Solirubrobacteraceae bacterium]|jgi:hypothetical protein|nr:hypothetical protein [Solirubrobacteraceae bacterium]